LAIISAGGSKPGMKGATVILLGWAAFLFGIIIFWIKAGYTNIDIRPGGMRMVGWLLLGNRLEMLVRVNYHINA